MERVLVILFLCGILGTCASSFARSQGATSMVSFGIGLSVWFLSSSLCIFLTDPEE